MILASVSRAYHNIAKRHGRYLNARPPCIFDVVQSGRLAEGETGEHVRLGDLSSFFDRQLSDAARELGGTLGREHFAHRVLGWDPLRLLPTLPFMMQHHVRGEFFETPLWRALALKQRLFLAYRDVPNGAEIDCSFWRP
jgi:hypothetical protein